MSIFLKTRFFVTGSTLSTERPDAKEYSEGSVHGAVSTTSLRTRRLQAVLLKFPSDLITKWFNKIYRSLLEVLKS